MILVDTGPLVAMFDASDDDHRRCVGTAKGVRVQMRTTVPVLTETFHMLGPDTPAADNLRQTVLVGALGVWWLDAQALERAFELMDQYRDHPMDFADASLVVAAEVLGVRKVFTLNRGDFSTYRLRRGHRLHAFELLP
jgi:uncharacterized protein